MRRWLSAWRLVLVVALGVGAGIAAYRNRPEGMPAEVVGGLILLALTVLGVEWLVGHLDDRRRANELAARWEGLGGVPFRSLAAAVGDIVDGLAWLLTGSHPFDRPRVVDEGRAARLHEVLTRRSGCRVTPVPPAGQCALFAQRLDVLLPDDRWCELAVSCTDLLKWSFRDRIGVWAAPMLDRAELTEVLTRFSLLDARIGELQQPLRRLAGYPHEEQAASPEEAKDRFFAVLTEAISLREDLQRAALPVQGQSRSRVQAQLAAFARHRAWLRAADRKRLDARADGADRVLPDGHDGGDAATWRRRRQRLLATSASAEATEPLLRAWADQDGRFRASAPGARDGGAPAVRSRSGSVTRNPSSGPASPDAAQDGDPAPGVRTEAARSPAGSDGHRLDDELEDLVLRGPLVDTHEHLLTDAELERQRPDVLVDLFGGYLTADLLSAGASPEAVSRLLDVTDEDLAGRFAGVEQAWKDCHHTGFGQAALRIARRAYGLDDLSAQALSRLSGDAAGLRSPEHRITVLRGEAVLDHVQVDDLHWRCTPDPRHPDFFLHDISWLLFAGGDRRTRLDLGGTGRDFDGIAEASGIHIADLESLREAMEWVVATFGPLAVALKSQHAYVRGLAYRARGDGEAARALRRVLAGAGSEEDMRCVGDFALAEGARLAAEHDLPFKLHTGYLAGNGTMTPDDIRPGAVAPLLRQFPTTRFVLMHLAYPFADEVVALAKHYPNVHLDWCWAWSLDPIRAGRTLRAALHAVPLNKLLIFGGDATYAHAARAYSEQAREGLLAVLREEVADRLLTPPEAVRVAGRLMAGNQLDLFDVERARTGCAAAVAPAG